MVKINYKQACEDALELIDSEFLRGAESLYHHLQSSIIGHDELDAISIEVLKFLKPLRKRIKLKEVKDEQSNIL